MIIITDIETMETPYGFMDFDVIVYESGAPPLESSAVPDLMSDRPRLGRVTIRGAEWIDPLTNKSIVLGVHPSVDQKIGFPLSSIISPGIDGTKTRIAELKEQIRELKEEIRRLEAGVANISVRRIHRLIRRAV